MNGGFEFRLAGIPVKVLWFFFFVAVMFGSGYRTTPLVVTWVAVMFGALVLHEMGHALVYRAFGVQPRIEIHGFGGTTYGRSLPIGRDLIVSLAGPAAGLMVGIPAYYYQHHTTIVRYSNAWYQLDMVVLATFIWSLLNLLPLMPLDGGNATNAVLSMVFRRDMTRVTRYLSLVTGAAVVLYALQIGQAYGALLIGYFMFLNIAALRRGGTNGRFQPTYAPRSARTGRPVDYSSSGPSARQQRKRQRKADKTPDWRSATPSSSAPVAPPVRDRKPASKISQVGWVQGPSTQGPANERTFDDEMVAARRFLRDGQPEMALISVERARGRSRGLEQRTLVEELATEIGRHISGAVPPKL